MFVIIDGSAILNECYYRTLPDEVKHAKTDEEKEANYDKIMQTGDGVFINGVCNYLQVLLGILYYQKPEHIAVCFDESREDTFRRQMYPAYKAQRPETAFPLKQQLRLAQEMTRRVGIPVLMSREYEADDYAGTLARIFSKSEPVILMTKDRDYFQLLNKNVHAWIPQSAEKLEALRERYGECQCCPPGMHEYTPDIVLREIGVRPDQITDWKGISGDPSDNLPGIYRVGDSAAIPLLAKYGTLERIFEAIEDCKTEAEEKALFETWKSELGMKRNPIRLMKEGKETGFLSKQLATIKCDVSVDRNIRHYEAPEDFCEFLDIAEEYGMEPLIELINHIQEDYEYRSSGAYEEYSQTETEYGSSEPDEADEYEEPEFV